MEALLVSFYTLHPIYQRAAYCCVCYAVHAADQRRLLKHRRLAWNCYSSLSLGELHSLHYTTIHQPGVGTDRGVMLLNPHYVAKISFVYAIIYLTP